MNRRVERSGDGSLLCMLNVQPLPSFISRPYLLDRTIGTRRRDAYDRLIGVKKFIDGERVERSQQLVFLLTVTRVFSFSAANRQLSRGIESIVCDRLRERDSAYGTTR